MFRWMGKKQLLGIIVLSSGLCLWNAAFGGTEFKQCVHYVEMAYQNGIHWKNKLVRDAHADKLQKEVAAVDAEIRDTRAALADRGTSRDPAKVAALELLFNDLIARKSVLEDKQAELVELNDLAKKGELRKIRRVNDVATKARLASSRNIASYDAESRAIIEKAECDAAAAVVREFLSAVHAGDVSDAKVYCTDALRDVLCTAKLEGLKASAPRGAYDVVIVGGRYEAVFAGAVKLRLVVQGKSVKVSEVLWS